MKTTEIRMRDDSRKPVQMPMTWVHTLIIGSGAAGLNAAVQLRANGIEDILIVTEGLKKGTSINTGSDKQTYYKLGLCGDHADSPADMAATYFEGGSMHGDLALVEASLSARAFINLVNLGVPFPRDEYGQFVGYKTDHDPRQRATSIGPYTSREMCRALIREIQRLGVEVREKRNVVRLLVVPEAGGNRAAGAIVMRDDGAMEAYGAANVVFAVGGPGGLYDTSVYPQVHTGAIGLALLAGAKAQNLPESQYGMASTKFRWNVSGTYMQAIPRFISTMADGSGEPREFLRDYFASASEMNSMVFLKGYQWPFDARKAVGGSSLIDILVYIESVIKGRKVFLDFRSNPEGFSFDGLSAEAKEYLTRSKALQDTPLARLRAMNPAAIEMYAEHGINLAADPLEIAVCAQHNNGGLACTHWWESDNIKHLFPIGEVNGSHGIYRPGGSALNSGQVGAIRAAEFIANRYRESVADPASIESAAAGAASELNRWLLSCETAKKSWRDERDELRKRMSKAGAHIRSESLLGDSSAAAWKQYRRIADHGCRYDGPAEAAEALGTCHLCFAHAVYLDSILHAVRSGVGSRGSSIILSHRGTRVHPALDDSWCIEKENEAFRSKVLETLAGPDGRTDNRWAERRPLPKPDSWFETAWARFRSGEIYGK